MEMPLQSSIKLLAIAAVSSCSCYWQETSPHTLRALQWSIACPVQFVGHNFQWRDPKP
jgi:hypothetical protein